MLNRCPFYDICSFTDRITNGNNEYHCLGSINYDYCQKYKNLITYHNRDLLLDPIEDLNKLLRELYAKLHQIVSDEIFIAILNQKGKIIYCDYSGLENQIEFIKNFAQANFQDISIGKFLLETNENNFGFYKISFNTLIVVNLKSDKLNLFDLFNSIFQENASKIDTVVERIDQFNKAILEKETTKVSFFTIIYNLKSRLEESTFALDFADELDNALKAISQIYAWHPIVFEISDISNRLKSYKKDDQLTSEDKEELNLKINEWEKKANSFKE